MDTGSASSRIRYNHALTVFLDYQSHPVAVSGPASQPRPARSTFSNYFRSDHETGSRGPNPDADWTTSRIGNSFDREIQISPYERRKMAFGCFRFRYGLVGMQRSQHGYFRFCHDYFRS